MQSWIELVILILSSFRLTHLLVYDEITSFIRKPFILVTEETDDNGDTIELQTYRGTGLRRWIGMVLSCHWCTGVWSSVVIVLIYMYVPVLFPLLLVLAIAGAAAFVESLLK